MDVFNLLYDAIFLKVSVTSTFSAVFSIDQSSYLYGSFLLIYSRLCYTVLVFCVLRHTLHYNF